MGFPETQEKALEAQASQRPHELSLEQVTEARFLILLYP